MVRHRIPERHGVGAAALHQRPVPLAPVGHEGEPGGQRPEAARVLRPEVHEVRPLAEVGGGRREDLPLQGRVAGEGEAGVVRDVEPLVGVAGDRVGLAEPLEPGGPVRIAGGEEAEGAVHVEPGVAGARHLGHGDEVVEVAGVHVAGAGHHDGRPPAGLAEPGVERPGVDRLAPRQAGHPLQRAAPDAEHRQRLADAGVRGAAHHEGARQPGQPRLGHVQAEPLAGPLARRGEPHQVGLGAAGDEDPLESLRHAEERAQQRERVALHRGGRRVAGRAQVLVVGRGEPVARQRRRRRAAGDEAEVARSGRAGQERLAAVDEVGEGALGAPAHLRERRQLEGGGQGGRHRPVAHRGQEGAGGGARPVEDGGEAAGVGLDRRVGVGHRALHGRTAGWWPGPRCIRAAPPRPPPARPPAARRRAPG